MTGEPQPRVVKVRLSRTDPDPVIVGFAAGDPDPIVTYLEDPQRVLEHLGPGEPLVIPLRDEAQISHGEADAAFGIALDAGHEVRLVIKPE